MKVKIIKRTLKESLNEDSILDILKLIGEAHDKIMEAQDLISDIVEYDEYEDEDYEESTLYSSLEYILDDLEASLSEYDYMGEDDPVEAFKDALKDASE